MEEMKVPIQHVMLLEFKNTQDITETTKKICSAYGQGVIIDDPVWNWFSKFCSGNAFLRDESRISTWPQHIPIHNLLPLEKDRKSEQARYLSSSYSYWED